MFIAKDKNGNIVGTAETENDARMALIIADITDGMVTESSETIITINTTPEENDISLTESEYKAYISVDEGKAKINEIKKNENNALIKAQIAELETGQLRATRELILDSTNLTSKNKLQALEDEIMQLRAQLQ